MLRDSPRTFAVLQRYGAHDRSESKAFVDALLDLKEVVGRRLGETVQHQRRQEEDLSSCLLYTSPSPRDVEESRMPSSA